jgi:KUP system potassium uptake protein
MGRIAPAISVLSALEGLDIAIPTSAPYVLPLSVLILIALFAIQPQGTARIGRVFGPIMAFWFGTIAVLGLWGVIQQPSVLLALDPRYGIDYLFSGDAAGFLVLGGVFLCVTGAEALYADMGHFGAAPIRLARSAISSRACFSVMPASRPFCSAARHPPTTSSTGCACPS